MQVSRRLRARATAGVPLSHKFGSTASLLHHVLDLHHLLDASGWQHRLEYGLVVCSQEKHACCVNVRVGAATHWLAHSLTWLNLLDVAGVVSPDLLQVRMQSLLRLLRLALRAQTRR